MVFKLNINQGEKAWKFELEGESLIGKKIGDKVDGKEIDARFEDYEFEITGGSDNAGFPLCKSVEGLALKRVLLKKGWGMKDNKKGIRRRKTVRGNQISSTTSQINMKVIKEGTKKLQELFPEQNQAKKENKT